MQSTGFKKAVLSGIAGTIAMTALTYMAPFMGMPEMNIPKMLSDFMSVPIIVG